MLPARAEGVCAQSELRLSKAHSEGGVCLWKWVLGVLQTPGTQAGLSTFLLGQSISAPFPEEQFCGNVEPGAIKDNGFRTDALPGESKC